MHFDFSAVEVDLYPGEFNFVVLHVKDQQGAQSGCVIITRCATNIDIDLFC